MDPKYARFVKKAKETIGATHGNVVTTIFVNEDDKGKPYYRVVQDRKYVWNGEDCWAITLRPRDLFDAANGAHWASQKIQERQREDRRRGSLPGPK